MRFRRDPRGALGVSLPGGRAPACPVGLPIGGLHRPGARWRRASWGSALALFAVLAIFGIYATMNLHGEPEVAPMDGSARLAALRAQRVAAAAAPEPTRAAPLEAAEDTSIPTKVEVAAARIEAQPVAPRALPVERAGVLAKGATLEAALTGLFVHGDAAKQVVAAFRTLRDPRRLRPGTRLLARFDGNSALDAFSLREVIIAPAGPDDNVTVARAADGDAIRYEAKEGGIPGEIVRRVLRCGIRDNLAASLTRCGHDDALITMVARVLGERLDLEHDLRVGDELRVVFDELVAAGERVRIESIAAIDYRGGLGRFTALRFDDGRGQSGWYRPSGESFASFFLHEAVPGARFTSGFGMRMHPILLKMKPHLGIDLAAPTGTPVRAIAAGSVVATARGSVAGRYIKLRHARGYGSDYLHLSRVSRRVRKGARVKRGEIIGYVGTSGRSTAPHLHLSVRKGGAHIDPMSVRDEPGGAVAPAAKEAFEQEAAALMRLLDAVDGSSDGA